MKVLVFCAALVIATSVSGQELRDKVVPNSPSAISDVLVPETGILGVAFGSSEDATVQKLGKPSGYLSLTNGMSAMVYGPSTYLVFRNGTLQGGSFGQDFVPYTLRDLLSGSPVSALKPILDNGVYIGLKLDAVRKLVGPKGIWSTGQQRLTYTTANSSVILIFTLETSGPGNYDAATMPESAFRLYTISVLRNDIVRYLGNSY